MAQDNRYSRGKIYRLINNIDGEEYVGSTCDTLAKRLWRHKEKAKYETGRRVYTHLNEIGWDNVSIVLVCLYPCNTKMELERKEREVIEERKPNLNGNIPTRTTKEWYADNVDKVREKNAKWSVENADRMRELQARWSTNNRDKLREKDAKYRAENPEKVRETQAKYREANREAINARRRERMATDEAYREARNARGREYRAKKKAEREAQATS